MAADAPLDPYRLTSVTDLPGRTVDGERTICLAELSDAAGIAALAGLANGLGGHLLIGAEVADAGGTIRAVPGVDAGEAEAQLRQLAMRLDPPADDLLQIRTHPAEQGRDLVVATVRRSPRPPHLDTTTGLIFLSGPGGSEPVRSRAVLDELYAQGRAERERAERLIEGMIERLMIAHYAFYGIGVLACLQRPTADPYLWAREHLDELTDPSDAFMAEWGFTAEMVKVRPAEVELRNEREVCGILRVGRAGCVAIAETRRRPAGDVLGAPAELANRIAMLVETACRVLSHADAGVIVPRLFCEGLRSTRLITSRQPYDESRPCEVDSIQAPGPTGNAADPAYRQQLKQHLVAEFCRAYHVEPAL